MKALVQRVSSAAVTVGDEAVASIGPGLLVLLGVAEGDDEAVASIGPGLLVLLGVAEGDDEAVAERLAGKVRALRIFDDADGRMNDPLGEREALCASQFTLCADTSRGNRPSYTGAAEAEAAEPIYSRFCDALGAKRGRFGARMAVELVNDGPVTLLLES